MASTKNSFDLLTDASDDIDVVIDRIVFVLGILSQKA